MSDDLMADIGEVLEARNVPSDRATLRPKDATLRIRTARGEEITLTLDQVAQEAGMARQARARQAPAPTYAPPTDRTNP